MVLISRFEYLIQLECWVPTTYVWSRTGLTLTAFKPWVRCFCSPVHTPDHQTYRTDCMQELLFLVLTLRILAITPHIRFLSLCRDQSSATTHCTTLSALYYL